MPWICFLIVKIISIVAYCLYSRRLNMIRYYLACFFAFSPLEINACSNCCTGCRTGGGSGTYAARPSYSVPHYQSRTPAYHVGHASAPPMRNGYATSRTTTGPRSRGGGGGGSVAAGVQIAGMVAETALPLVVSGGSKLIRSIKTRQENKSTQRSSDSQSSTGTSSGKVLSSSRKPSGNHGLSNRINVSRKMSLRSESVSRSRPQQTQNQSQSSLDADSESRMNMSFSQREPHRKSSESESSVSSKTNEMQESKSSSGSKNYSGSKIEIHNTHIITQN